MRRGLKRTVSGILTLSMFFMSVQHVNAQEGNGASDFKKAEEIADIFIDSVREGGKDTGLWSQKLIIEKEKKLYNADESISAYCIEYTDNNGSDCGYVVVGADENYAPIVEYAMAGDFLDTGNKLYYLGDESVSYFENAGNGILKNALSEDERILKKEEVQNVPQEQEYVEEWESFEEISVDTHKNIKEVKPGNAKPPTAGGGIMNPDLYESGWNTLEVLDVKNYDLKYFSTADFPGYDGHCGPTAGVNMMFYWYNRSSSKYGNLRYPNSWNESFAKLYKYMKTDAAGTTEVDFVSGMKKYLTDVDFGNSVVKYNPNPVWSDLVSEIEGGSNGYPFIFSVEAHYLYKYHMVLALGYYDFKYASTQSATNTTHSRYLRIADGWEKSANRFIHYKVGHDSKQKSIITMHPFRSVEVSR